MSCMPCDLFAIHKVTRRGTKLSFRVLRWLRRASDDLGREEDL